MGKVVCPECAGKGYIPECGDGWISARGCLNCKGTGSVDAPMTRGDFLRSRAVKAGRKPMSDERIADVCSAERCPPGRRADECSFDGKCIECYLDWLKTPMSEEELRANLGRK